MIRFQPAYDYHYRYHVGAQSEAGSQGSHETSEADSILQPATLARIDTPRSEAFQSSPNPIAPNCSDSADTAALENSDTQKATTASATETKDIVAPAQATNRRRASLITNGSSNSENSASSGDLMEVTFQLLTIWLNKLRESPEEARSAVLMKLKRAATPNVMDAARCSSHCGLLAFQVLHSNNSSAYSNAEEFVMRRCMLHPTSSVSAIWELASLVMIAYDFVVLPLQIFSPQENLFMTVMEWIQRLFWTISIPYCFCLGYMSKDGKVEVRPRKVAQHYVSTWFPFDLTVVISDWLEVILKSVEFLGTVRVVKTLRVSRLLRMMRIVRSSKLPKAMGDLDTRIFSERVVILLGIAKISLQFVCLGHLVACSWYGIGRYGSQNGGAGWVRHYDYLDDSLSYRYATSLHWAGHENSEERSTGTR